MNHNDVAFIVDDDPIHQFGMKVLLNKVKLTNEIKIYNNGQEAIDALTDLIESGRKLPSVIFLDLNMPIKDGWGFLDDFVKIPHNNREKVVVYVVSSSISPMDQEKAKEYDVVSNYLFKPIGIDQMAQILKELDLLNKS